jgi:hypothetical protein
MTYYFRVFVYFLSVFSSFYTRSALCLENDIAWDWYYAHIGMLPRSEGDDGLDVRTGKAISYVKENKLKIIIPLKKYNFANDAYIEGTFDHVSGNISGGIYGFYYDGEAAAIQGKYTRKLVGHCTYEEIDFNFVIPSGERIIFARAPKGCLFKEP